MATCPPPQSLPLTFLSSAHTKLTEYLDGATHASHRLSKTSEQVGCCIYRQNATIGWPVELKQIRLVSPLSPAHALSIRILLTGIVINKHGHCLHRYSANPWTLKKLSCPPTYSMTASHSQTQAVCDPANWHHALLIVTGMWQSHVANNDTYSLCSSDLSKTSYCRV